MPISMYQVSIPVFQRALTQLAHILELGEQHAREHDVPAAQLLEARLAPDMFPLPRQVQIATDGAKGGAARLAGVAVPSYEDNETSFAELQARIRKTLDFLASIDPASVDGSETRDVTIKLRGEDTHFQGQDYLLGFVLPNLFFHVTTAYDILRNQGVPLGKRHYLGN